MTNTCPSCGYSSGTEIIVCEQCGIVVSKFLARKEREAREEETRNAPVQCPQCKSTQINAGKKGFGLGKAVGGALILGPLGLLGGFVGSGKLSLTCIKCGHEWNTPR